ncbi:MAG: type II toxin-antitoxin system VapC family toxin [bacterium]
MVRTPRPASTDRPRRLGSLSSGGGAGAAAARYRLSRFVIDASAAVELLLRTPIGRRVQELVEGSFVMAPALLDVEVLSVLRRAVLKKGLSEARASLALEDLSDWPIDRIPHTALIREAWRHRHNVTAYDAFYVAAARLYEASLLTIDGPLSRAPALGIEIRNLRLEQGP